MEILPASITTMVAFEQSWDNSRNGIAIFSFPFFYFFFSPPFVQFDLRTISSLEIESYRVSIVNCDSDTRSHNFTIFIIIAIAKRRNLRLSLFNYLSLTGVVIKFWRKNKTRSISSSFFFFYIRNFHIIRKRKTRNNIIASLLLYFPRNNPSQDTER